MVFAVFCLIFFKFWPPILQEITWYTWVSLVIAYFAIIIIRAILTVIMFHFGFNFSLFPNYFDSFFNFKNKLTPVFSFETRSDFFNPISLMFRLMSSSFIAFLIYQFTQDEKAMQDFKEIRDHVYDIYEFSTDVVLG